MTKRIGYLQLECGLYEGEKREGSIFFAVCKLSRKLALIHSNQLSPMIVQSTSITDGKCFDGKYCLNLDCEYCESKSLEDAVSRSGLKGPYKDVHDATMDFVRTKMKQIEEGLYIEDEWFDDLEIGSIIPDWLRRNI